MRTVIIGGSFNPPHHGHIHLIELVRRDTDYERILLIPLHTPNHKQAVEAAAPEDRLAMLELLVEELHTDCIIDTCELERGGISYTYDTVVDIMARYPDIDDRIGIVVGDDLLEGIASWYNFEQLKDLVTFIVAYRDADEESVMQRINAYTLQGVDMYLLRSSRVKVSSSLIRQRIRAGVDVRPLLPRSIIEYIESHGLYRD